MKSHNEGVEKKRASRGSYRGTSLVRNKPLLGLYSRTMSGAIWWPRRGGVFLMSEVPLQPDSAEAKSGEHGIPLLASRL